MEEVTGRLRNVEQRNKNTASAVDKEGRLLLMEEEWLACLKLRDNTDESNGPSSSRKGSKKSWKSHGRTRGKDGDQKKESTNGRPIQCSNYVKRGHLSKNCWSKLRNKKKAEMAHVAQSEEDEPALFMVSACVPNFDSKSMEVEVIDDDVEPEKELQLGIAKATPVGEPIQLEEERVFAQIGESEEQHEHR